MTKYSVKKYLFANWKLYLSETESVQLARSLQRPRGNVQLTVFPSEISFIAVAKIVRSLIPLGSQNIAPKKQQAATGEVSGSDLKTFGCRYVLVGHSERRALGESDAIVRSKLSAAVRSRLIPVLCVGETKYSRTDAAQRFVRLQLKRDLKGWKGKTLFVVYEPVWAISKAGRGVACPPEHACAMAEVIQRQLVHLIPKANSVLLYGGSVTAKNIAQYVDGTHFAPLEHGRMLATRRERANEDVMHKSVVREGPVLTGFAGALVGFASTKPSEIKKMAKAIV